MWKKITAVTMICILCAFFSFRITDAAEVSGTKQDVTDYKQISALISDTWDDDYFEKMVITPGTDTMEKDGEQEQVSDTFDVSSSKAKSITKSEDVLDNASYYGRIFARSGGLSDAVKQALKEQGLAEFELKPVVCNGIEQCKMALLKVGKVDIGNFIEGMACTGGCIGGAGCLTHGEKNKDEVDKYGMEAYEKTISSAISMIKNIQE